MGSGGKIRAMQSEQNRIQEEFQASAESQKVNAYKKPSTGNSVTISITIKKELHLAMKKLQIWAMENEHKELKPVPSKYLNTTFGTFLIDLYDSEGVEIPDDIKKVLKKH